MMTFAQRTLWHGSKKCFSRLNYHSSTGAITVALNIDGTGTVTGDISVGNDFINGGVNQIRGSNFNDTFNGSNRNENFDGWGGDDLLNGGAGFDLARYDSRGSSPGGITIDMGAGTVIGNDAATTASLGTDTLRGIEGIRATPSDDIYDARTFTATSTNGGADQGTFSEFEGMGGNDTIYGNGNTRISYLNMQSGVTVNLIDGTASGAATGTDTIMGGVNAVKGSNYADQIAGTGAAETFEGWGGDDAIDGKGGFDRARYDFNNASGYGVPLTNVGLTFNMATGEAVGRDAAALFSFGTDTLRSIEAIRGTAVDDIYDATGFSGSSTNAGSNGTFNEFEGMGGDDQITGNGNTRISYQNAGGDVIANLASGVATGGALERIPSLVVSIRFADHTSMTPSPVLPVTTHSTEVTATILSVIVPDSIRSLAEPAMTRSLAVRRSPASMGIAPIIPLRQDLLP